jgi:hypothetical protein
MKNLLIAAVAAILSLSSCSHRHGVSVVHTVDSSLFSNLEPVTK